MGSRRGRADSARAYHGPMLSLTGDALSELLQRGGWAMYPLLALSVVALALILERTWFWIRTNSPARRARFEQVAYCLRHGDRTTVAGLTSGDHSVYGRLVARVLRETPTEALAVEAIESQRPRLERFMPTLGTIITAAPMLGILGTVSGIIASFRILSATETVRDPAAVSGGIAEALLTTVVGLTIALVVLFPYNIFRAQIDRSLGRMDWLVAAAQQRSSPSSPRTASDGGSEG